MKHLLRMWLIQGIPFAFTSSPLLFEAIREWLAPLLKVSPFDITMIGSARTGYSWRPLPDFGKAFSGKSDLDLSVISQNLFDRVSAAFMKWRDDCEAGRARPHGDFQKDSLNRIPKNIIKGFIDPRKIPTKYEEIRKVEWAMSILRRKLEKTPDSPTVSDASIRVFATREAFERQLLVNLRRTQQSLSSSRPTTQ